MLEESSVQELATAYQLDLSSDRFAALGNGLIHDTYETKVGEKELVIQKINHHVFPNTPAVMNNIELISDCYQHLEKKIFLKLIFSSQGTSWVKIGGFPYRIFEKLPNSIAFDSPQSAKQIHEAASILNDFHEVGKQVNAKKIAVTIPNFHNIDFRLKQLEAGIKENYQNRLDRAKSFYEELQKMAGDMKAFYAAADSSFQIVHNDTKFNNYLFDHNENGLCLIDWDTIMPGSVYFDIGDTLRSISYRGAEDEIEGPFAKSFCQLFIEQTLSYRPLDRSMLGRCGPYMAYIMAVRFLTDYFNGDRYYRTNSEHQNLLRAQKQFSILQSLQSLS